MSNETCPECFALLCYGHRIGCRIAAYDMADAKHATAMLAEMSRATFFGPCECGRPIYGTAMDRGRKCEVCRETEHALHDAAMAPVPPHMLSEHLRIEHEPPTTRATAGENRICSRIGCTTPSGRWWLCEEHEREYHALMRQNESAIAEEPKPPTLREWLGDRVLELGPWANVLREQPVPAGHISDLLLNLDTGWLDYVARGEHGPERGSLTQHAVTAAIAPQGPFYEALQMALFTRHPDAKPTPRKPTLRTWFGNEEEL